jgi:hypothetical protein
LCPFAAAQVQAPARPASIAPAARRASCATPEVETMTSLDQDVHSQHNAWKAWCAGEALNAG